MTSPELMTEVRLAEIRDAVDGGGAFTVVSSLTASQLLGHIAALTARLAWVEAELRASQLLRQGLSTLLAASEADEARMDWLEREVHVLGWDTQGERLVIRAYDGHEAVAETFRAAIDSARTAPEVPRE